MNYKELPEKLSEIIDFIWDSEPAGMPEQMTQTLSKTARDLRTYVCNEMIDSCNTIRGSLEQALSETGNVGIPNFHMWPNGERLDFRTVLNYMIKAVNQREEELVLWRNDK